MHRMTALRKLISMLLIFFFTTQTIAANEIPLTLNMPEGVTPISRDIYYLHMSIFWICVAIGLLVFVIIIYSLIKHRKSKKFPPAQFHSSVKIEVIWAVVPLLILAVMAIPATIVLMRMYDETKADINIKITGYQWKWKYDYLDQGISFFSTLSTPRSQIENKSPKGRWYLLEVNKPLVIPIHKKIRFLVTSNDVIHSWWVPALGIKRDAIPGYIHESWAKVEKPGIYRGQCAELCGLQHAFMPIVVIAKTEADFKKWVAEQTEQKKEKPTLTADMSKKALMTEGEKVYTQNCSVCHKADGAGQPPAFPALKGGKITTGPVPAHIDIVLNGKQGTAMQAFKGQLTNTEIAAVITYERNSWGNDNQQKYGKAAGGLIQPIDIAKAKGEAVAPAKTPSEPKTKLDEAIKKPAKKEALKKESKPNKKQPTSKPTSKTLSKKDLIAKGKTVYSQHCSVCHKADGAGMPPAFPALKGGKITTGPVSAHIDIVLNGKQGTAMQAFGEQLSDTEIAAVITYERNSWGNDNQQKYGKDAGGLIQPADIAKYKNKT